MSQFYEPSETALGYVKTSGDINKLFTVYLDGSNSLVNLFSRQGWSPPQVLPAFLGSQHASTCPLANERTLELS